MKQNLTDGARFIVVSLPDVDGLERTMPGLFPRDHEPGLWMDRDHPVLHGSDGLRPATLLAVLDYWNDWDTALFTIRHRQGAGTAKIRLAGRVERWNPRDLLLFACDQVERFLYHYSDLLPGDLRLARAIDAARRFAREEIPEEFLAEARSAAVAAYEEIGPVPSNVHKAATEELHKLRASDVALAAVLLASPDRPGDPVGSSARKAVLLGQQSSCRNAGGWIGAKVLSRARHAALLEYLGIGTRREWKAIRDGKMPGIGTRWGLNMATYEVVDFTEE